MKLTKLAAGELNQTKDVPGLLSCRIDYEIKTGKGKLDYTGPKFTPEMWHQVLSFFRWTDKEMDSESQVRLYVNTKLGRWGAWAFPQEARTGMSAREIVTTETPEQAVERFASWGSEPSGDWLYFCTVHHHCSASAFQSGTDEENAGMLLQGVQQLKALEADTSHLLTTFQQWSMVSDAKIQRTANKVSFLTTQRKMILDAKATLSIGQRLLKGNSQQEQMVDMALDYLEEDTSRTLGEIRDFSRFTDKLLTNDQIESGANAELARQQFAEFSAKLLTSGSAPAGADLIQIPGISSPAPVPMARPAGGFSSTSDDIDPFK